MGGGREEGGGEEEEKEGGENMALPVPGVQGAGVDLGSKDLLLSQPQPQPLPQRERDSRFT